ncbi:GNAT family N-acetyltransferase [Arthrobacter sp. EH-1B-1]|uniref:GNAT family N-acetyltransferase n=1 Tax=Arthrobacter vasquezii TaxID=2977629 RepID=A0ABT6D0Q4_9MICC|nr:GNAT family N-acetyltransferase [Arthrobacter vasquezii]MDF9279541.1 GNAT family N-acetyltransferase [Arthrobacter vasquezii]
MNLEPGTISIIQLAWSRLLGFEDGAMAGTCHRIYREDNNAPLLMFVSLFGKEALVGPTWALDAAKDLTGVELSRHSTLLSMSRPHGGRGLGEAYLYFSDNLPSFPDSGPLVSSDPAHARALERLCPPDDVAEVGLSAMENSCVLVDESSEPPLPLAGAGYDIWEGILAHLGVLTAPDERRRGHASYAVSVAVEESMAAGLIPQWRARTDNVASQRTALRAGFVHAGSQTSVVLESGAVRGEAEQRG